eukprot:3056752-Prymnesium_polylepis.1
MPGVLTEAVRRRRCTQRSPRCARRPPPPFGGVVPNCRSSSVPCPPYVRERGGRAEKRSNGAKANTELSRRFEGGSTCSVVTIDARHFSNARRMLSMALGRPEARRHADLA